MTKKHFIAIAKVIQEYRINGCKLTQLGRLANSIADVCQESNPNFQREKFLELALRADID